MKIKSTIILTTIILTLTTITPITANSPWIKDPNYDWYDGTTLTQQQESTG